MPKDELLQNWEKIKIKIREKFNKLSDEDLEKIKGKKEALISLIEKKHGLNRDKATEIVRQIEDSLQLAGAGASREHSRASESHPSHSQAGRETRYQDQNPRNAQRQPRDTQRGFEEREGSEHHPFDREQQGGKGRW